MLDVGPRRLSANALQHGPRRRRHGRPGDGSPAPAPHDDADCGCRIPCRADARDHRHQGAPDHPPDGAAELPRRGVPTGSRTPLGRAVAIPHALGRRHGDLRCRGLAVGSRPHRLHLGRATCRRGAHSGGGHDRAQGLVAAMCITGPALLAGVAAPVVRRRLGDLPPPRPSSSWCSRSRTKCGRRSPCSSAPSSGCARARPSRAVPSRVGGLANETLIRHRSDARPNVGAHAGQPSGRIPAHS